MAVEGRLRVDIEGLNDFEATHEYSRGFELTTPIPFSFS
jgi:hypothetical protein